MQIEQLHNLGTRAEQNYPIGRDRAIIDLIRSRPGIDTKEISQVTGMSWSAVSKVTPTLLQDGWIKNPDQKPRVRKGKAGPLSEVFEVNPDAGYFLGVQIEPDSIKARTIDFSFGKMEDFDEEITLPQGNISLHIRGLQVALDRSLQKLQQAGKLKRLMVIGFSLPGQWADDRLDQQINLSMIKDTLSTVGPRISDAVSIAWDRSAKCAGQLYAEKGDVSDEAAKSVLYVNLGKSVETAIFLDKKPFHGNQGGAGGPSHYPLENQEKGTRCGCGINECTEYELSEPAMVSKWNKANNGDGNQPLDEIARLAKAGDPTAQKFFDEYGEKLAKYVHPNILILNPSIIAIDGEIAQHWILFYPFFTESIRKLVGLKYVLENLRFTYLNLGSDAKAIGAAISAYHKLES